MPGKRWGERLASVMRKRKITQRKLALDLGVSAQAVGKWVKDGGDIEFSRLRQLSSILNVNWVWLRYGDEAMASAQEQIGTEDRVAILRYEVLRQAVEMEHRARAALGLLNIGVWEVNFATGENHWSVVARQLLGADPSARATQSLFRSLVLAEDLPGIDLSLIQARKVGGIVEQRFRAKSHPTVTIRALGKAIKDKNGDVERIIGIAAEANTFACYINRQLFSLKLEKPLHNTG